MRNIEGGATHARTTNKQTNREPRRRQLPTYLHLPKTLGYDASGTDALACIGIRHAFTNRGLLLAAIDSRHGSSVRRLTLGHKGGCASARFKASPQVLGGSRQRVVESDRALDVITPTRERPRTLVRTYTCMHACMHACMHVFICMNAWM